MKKRLDSKILITGHSGFVGAWLCAILDYWNCDVTGFSLIEEDGALYKKIKGRLRTKNIYGDLRDKEEVESLIRTVNPDIVFHIAAFGFVKECFDDPERAFSTNVTGTLNLFEALSHMNKPCRIVVASSDKVYKNTGKSTYLFSEEDHLGGCDPYSSSKTCEDLLAQSYFDTYLAAKGFSLCIIRPSNILGGGDHNMNRLIPSIYYNLSLGKSPEIRNPNSVRPWQNIFDIIDAYLTVADEFDSGCHIYNVGPETDGIKTVGEIASYVSNLYGTEFNAGFESKSAFASHEKAFLGLSIDKIKAELKWQPKRTLEQTLEEIYYFYNHDDGNNTYDICMSQIKNYYNED